MRRNHGWNEKFGWCSNDFDNALNSFLPTRRPVPLAATTPKDGILGVDHGGPVSGRRRLSVPDRQ